MAKGLWKLGMPLRTDVGSFGLKPYQYDWLGFDRYEIPTYGEVIDWFSSKGIHITFDAFFTFALADNVGYLWKVSYIDKSNGDMRLLTISEEDAWDGKEGYGGSFELVANDAIRYAMQLKNNI